MPLLLSSRSSLLDTLMFIEQSGGSTWKQERRLRLCSAENGDGAEPLPERLYQLVLVIGMRLDLGSEKVPAP